MATKTLSFKDAVPTGATLHRSLQDGGVAPATATTTTGWVPGTNVIGQSCLQNGGSEVPRTDGTWGATLQPSAAPSLTRGDCWRSELPFDGTFANTNWSFAFGVRSVTAAYTGRFKLAVRVWRSSSPNGANAVELTGARQASAATSANLSTSADTTVTVTWAPGATVSLLGQYLFVNVGVEVTTAGGGTTQDIDFRVGTGFAITTPDFVPTPVPSNQTAVLTVAPPQPFQLPTAVCVAALALLAAQPAPFVNAPTSVADASRVMSVGSVAPQSSRALLDTTRLWLNAGSPSGVTPTFESGWDRTSEASRCQILATSPALGISFNDFWQNSTAAANERALGEQFISPPMLAGIAFSTADTIKMQLGCRESGATDNINRAPLCVKVVSRDGGTLRATLKTLGHYGPNTTEWSTIGTGKTIADGDALDAGYTTVDGDRLVIEVGGQVDATGGTTVDARHYFGGGGSGDFGENETDSAVLFSPWFQISRQVLFGAEQPVPFSNLFAPTPALRHVAFDVSVTSRALLDSAPVVTPSTDQIRSPLFVTRREIPSILDVGDPGLSQPLTLRDAVVAAPVSNPPQQPPPYLPRVNDDSTAGTPKTLVADAQVPVGRATTPVAPDRPRGLLDTSAGTPYALRDAQAPFANPQQLAPDRLRQLFGDTSAHTPKTLTADAQLPVGENAQIFAPDRIRPVVDTTRGTPKPLIVDAQLPVGGATSAPAPDRPRAPGDTSAGTPYPLIAAIAAAPFANPQVFAPDRPRAIVSDTTRGTPKTLTADAQGPVGENAQVFPPDRPRPVTDTTRGTPKELTADAQAPVGGSNATRTPERPRALVDTSAGTPYALLAVVAPPPFANLQVFAPDAPRALVSDSTRGSPKTLIADAQAPVGENAQVFPPDRQRPVVDTTQGTPKTLTQDAQAPVGTGLQLEQPNYPHSVVDTSHGTPRVAIVELPPPPPGAQVQLYQPDYPRSVVDTSQSTPKTLIDDAQAPVGQSSFIQPVYFAPVVDTSQSTPLGLIEDSQPAPQAPAATDGGFKQFRPAILRPPILEHRDVRSCVRLWVCVHTRFEVSRAARSVVGVMVGGTSRDTAHAVTSTFAQVRVAASGLQTAGRNHTASVRVNAVPTGTIQTRVIESSKVTLRCLAFGSTNVTRAVRSRTGLFHAERSYFTARIRTTHSSNVALAFAVRSRSETVDFAQVIAEADARDIALFDMVHRSSE